MASRKNRKDEKYGLIKTVVKKNGISNYNIFLDKDKNELCFSACK